MLGQFSPEGPGAAVLAHLPRSGICANLEFSQMGHDVCLEAYHCHEEIKGSSSCANIGGATYQQA